MQLHRPHPQFIRLRNMHIPILIPLHHKPYGNWQQLPPPSRTPLSSLSLPRQPENITTPPSPIAGKPYKYRYFVFERVVSFSVQP
ncbi:hypothetical protein Hanom_Chr07g00594371 [Helianthus anomalus]